MNIKEFIPHGRINAISQEELSKRTGLEPREVRQAIFNARCMGIPICTVCGTHNGIYMPESPSEAMGCYMTLQKRIISARKAIRPIMNYIKAGGGDV